MEYKLSAQLVGHDSDVRLFFFPLALESSLPQPPALKSVHLPVARLSIIDNY